MSGATKLLTAGGGGVSLTPASSIASDVTVNVPSQNCTLGIQGPAFNVWLNGAMTGISSSTFTKITFNTVDFDTASCWSNTNYRFTPNVAGYYQISAQVDLAGTGLNYAIPAIRRNNIEIYFGNYTSVSGGEYNVGVSGIVYCNGTTDYIEIFGYGGVSSGTVTVNGNARYQTWVSGALVRAA